MKKHIGIYSGTFDPVHAGHITFALRAKRILQLDRVILIPEPVPRNKANVTNVTIRKQRLEVAINEHPGLEVFSLSTSQFTVKNTLPTLHEQLPGSSFTFLMGSDVALHLPTWDDVALLAADVSFVVALREGDTQVSTGQVFKRLETALKTPIRYTIIESPHPQLRSSAIRNK